MLHKITWSVTAQSQTIIEPSAITLHLNDEKTLGEKCANHISQKENINTIIPALFYKKDLIEDITRSLH